MTALASPPAAVVDPLRLAALAGYGILDTPPEQGFDDIVQLATQLCDAPVALVSLVTDDRQWFKAREGFALCETPLDQSVCAHALVEDELLVIPDLSLDPRTRLNPLVTGEPFIAFYAGAVLRSADGQALGAICVLDRTPRPDGLTPGQTVALIALGRQVSALMELRRAVVQRDEALALQREAEARARSDAAALADNVLRLNLAVDAADIGIYDYDVRSGEVRWDARTRELFGLSGEAPLTYDGDFLGGLHPDDRVRTDAAVRAALDPHGSGAFACEYRTIAPGDGRMRWVAARGRLLIENGDAARLVGTVLDITERRRAEDQQKLVAQEISHRLKNILAMVQAMASQTLRSAQNMEEAREALSKRLVALSTAHDLLLSDPMAKAAMGAAVRDAVRLLDDPPGRIRVEGPEIEIGPQTAMSLALMLHELCTNAAKYGALSNGHGHVAVSWRICGAGDALEMTWAERDGPPVAAPTRKGFGSRLIERSFAGRVGGSVRLDYQPAGFVCTMEAPLAGLTGSD